MFRSTVLENLPKSFCSTSVGHRSFLEPEKSLEKNGKEVLLRKTLAYGTHHGIGVFCLTQAGESQIGWVPEKDEAN